jgi:pterin-4a-carbinolamine dehydratase
MCTEDKEAAIIRKVYSAGYSHAENVLHRLAHLQRKMPHHEAIDVLYVEVVEGDD